MSSKVLSIDSKQRSVTARSTVETDLQIGRYVDLASQIDITMERQCLRWWMTARPCIHPLLN